MMSGAMSDSVRGRGHVRLHRPWAVTFVACLQLLKGVVLLSTGTLLRVNPDAVTNSQSIFYPLLFVAMRGNSAVIEAAMKGGDVLPGIIFVLGLYIAAIGLGLWWMQMWARRSVLATCGMTVAFYAKSVLFPDEHAAGTSVGSGSPDHLYFHVLIVLDALIFVYFLRSSSRGAFEVDHAQSLAA